MGIYPKFISALTKPESVFCEDIAVAFLWCSKCVVRSSVGEVAGILRREVGEWNIQKGSIVLDGTCRLNVKDNREAGGVWSIFLSSAISAPIGAAPGYSMSLT